MKYAVMLVILVACGLAYVHSEQPDLWNQLVKSVGLANYAVASPSSLSSSDSTSSGTPSASGPTAQTPSDQPEIITPSSTNYINPDHVRPVEQPTQPPPPATN